MIKHAMFVICLGCMVVLGLRAAYSKDCTNDEHCPCQDWANVQENLEWTLKNQEAYKCVDVKIRSGSKNAYDAFKDCNDVFRKFNSVTGVDTPAMYEHCGEYVCNWFRAHSLTPACAGNP